MVVFENPTATLLSLIKLGYRRRNRVVCVPYVAGVVPLLHALVASGVVQTFTVTIKTGSSKLRPRALRLAGRQTEALHNSKFGTAGGFYEFKVFLKYVNGQPAVSTIRNY
jgi:ribosomal protein S8